MHIFNYKTINYLQYLSQNQKAISYLNTKNLNLLLFLSYKNVPLKINFIIILYKKKIISLSIIICITNSISVIPF